VRGHGYRFEPDISAPIDTHRTFVVVARLDPEHSDAPIDVGGQLAPSDGTRQMISFDDAASALAACRVLANRGLRVGCDAGPARLEMVPGGRLVRGLVAFRATAAADVAVPGSWRATSAVAARIDEPLPPAERTSLVGGTPEQLFGELGASPGASPAPGGATGAASSRVDHALDLAPIVALVGICGIGKTTLARRVLASKREAGWSVWWGAVDPIANLPADRQGLMVLDDPNLDAEGLIALRSWTARRPGLRILITSRVPVPGALSVVVRPLPDDVATELLTRRITEERGVAPTGSDGVEVRALAEIAGGLPLALDLIARRCRAMAVASLRRRLSAGVLPLLDTAPGGFTLEPGWSAMTGDQRTSESAQLLALDALGAVRWDDGPAVIGPVAEWIRERT
jgi:hypothetical protein